MIVTAMLAFFDEPISDLTRCVESLPVLCDRVVAVDGAYRLVDGAEAASPIEQAEAIRDAAVRVGLDYNIIVPDEVWDGQVAKRDHMLKLAAAKSDWVMPVDADYVLHGIREPVRAELKASAADALVVDFHTTLPEGKKPSRLEQEGLAANSWHSEMAGETQKMALIFRALPEIRVEQHHWWYSGLKDNVRVALWGCDQYPRGLEHELFAPFVVEHRCLFRDKPRVLRNREFCERRDLQVVEQGSEA